MDLNKLKSDVATHLGVGATHLAGRFDRLVGNFAAHIQSELKYEAKQAYTAAVDQIGALSLREVCLLLAEGPAEQTRAMLEAEAIFKPVKAEGTGNGAQGTETKGGNVGSNPASVQAESSNG